MKILIVEDNPLLVQAIERAGEELRVGVDCATDGWEAIEKLESEEYAFPSAPRLTTSSSPSPGASGSTWW